MRLTLKVAILGICTILMLLIDLPLLRSVDEAEAIAGVRRRTARRTAVVVGGTTAAAASAATASANQQAAASQQQAAAAEAEAEAYKQQAAAAQAQATAAGVLPIGTVVTALPAGCTTVTSGGVEYHSCGGNYYRAAFQGSQLVYVTAQP
jgi:glucose/arabinose dehydrogenase